MFDIFSSLTIPPAIFYAVALILEGMGMDAALALYLPIYAVLAIGVGFFTWLILWAKPKFSVLVVSIVLSLTVGFALVFTLGVVVWRHGLWVLWALLVWFILMFLVRIWRKPKRI